MAATVERAGLVERGVLEARVVKVVPTGEHMSRTMAQWVVPAAPVERVEMAEPVEEVEVVLQL